MIETLKVKNFKGFKEYQVDLSRLNLLVGGNNSGKTTIFHALQIFFWCVDQTAEVAGKTTFRKTQVPELGGVPYFNARDLFFGQKTRSANAPTRIKISLKAKDIPELSFEIYAAFSRNLMVDGGGQQISLAQYKALKALKPVYVPGTIGITVKEEMYRTIAQERMILEGRQNQVLRNLVYRLSQEPIWKEFVGIIAPLFKLQEMKVPFDDTKDEWLTAVYRENNCEFDFVSAGSGFLQVINLLSFLFLHTSRVALLDEPDSHMHDDLQKLTFDILDRLSRSRNIQLIIATHSPTFVDAAGLDNVLLIDRAHPMPLRAQDVDTLVPLLSDRGLSLPPAKVMNTLKSRKALFVEGAEKDYEDFLQQVGEIVSRGFRALTRGLTVFETEGSTTKWPFDAIEYFERLIGVDLSYIFISDPDFLTDAQVSERENKARRLRKTIFHLSRRNRESYLLDPVVLSRAARAKWSRKNPRNIVPAELSADAIKEFILAEARENETETRSKLLVFQEPNLRLPAEQREPATLEVNKFFEDNYTRPLKNGEIPYRLLDSKNILKKVRTRIQKFAISVSDKEILQEFKPAEVPNEIKSIVHAISGLFGASISDARAGLQINLIEVPPKTTGVKSPNV